DRAFAGEPVAWTSSLGDATFECRLRPVADGRGGVAGIIGLAIDVTERKQAEDTRLTLERRLLEAQKLESLGVLAGGIAHDFNNLLVSVLGNASQAIDGAEGTITVRTGAVELGPDALRDTLHPPEAAPGPHVCVEVRDTGCGMDAATTAKVFDPFFSTKFTGRGLGLATVLGA